MTVRQHPPGAASDRGRPLWLLLVAVVGVAIVALGNGRCFGCREEGEA